MKICIIQTGGTIDKDYPKMQGGYAFEIIDSAAKRIIQRINPDLNLVFVQALRKDSQEITQKDRNSLAQLIQKEPTDKIILTHGTDTMKVTAEYLAARIHNKTIILTGALKPERMKDSDADFNLGGALIAVQHYSSGIYICMQGRCIPFHQVKRDKIGRFTKNLSSE